MSEPNVLTLEQLQSAVQSGVALRCVSRLEPAGGAEDKIFPPTYAGGVYAMEERLVENGEGQRIKVPCVLLDSVQSQANRMEEALLFAWEDQELTLPMMLVDFGKTPDGKPQTDELIAPIGPLTVLEAPHRIADAIFRDSVTSDGEAFRDSADGQDFEATNIRNATALFRLCPTALIFGTWDSTGSKGGLGNKFARALVSEIVGINAVAGVRTGSRLDPLQIGKCDLFEDKNGDYTPDETKAVMEKKSPKFYGSGEKRGKPSAINHGNVTPDLVRYSANDISKDRKNPDPLKSRQFSLNYSLRGSNDDFSTQTRYVSDEPEIQVGAVKPGGVTVDHALQTTVLSLAQLRRLRFPNANGERNGEQNQAARTVLAALALFAATRARETGGDLRSRCLLVPAEGGSHWEIVRSGDDAEQVSLTSAQALDLLDGAVEAAKKAGLPWSTETIELRPAQKLVDLVRKGREAEMEKGGEE